MSPMHVLSLARRNENLIEYQTNKLERYIKKQCIELETRISAIDYRYLNKEFMSPIHAYTSLLEGMKT